MSTSEKNSPEAVQTVERKKQNNRYYRKLDEAKPSEIPMLKYGNGNNFHKFKSTLSEVALKEYGNLGKLIDLEKYYIPTLTMPDYKAMGIDATTEVIMKSEVVKELA